jgi:hypothetical protein
MRRLLPVFAALAAVAGLGALLRYAQRFDPSAERGADNREGGMGEVSIRLEGSTIISRREGVMEWTMRADRVDFVRAIGGDLENYRAIEFVGVREGLLYRDGKLEAAFSAQRAVFDQPSQRLDVAGAIRLRSRKGDQLDAETLVWSQQDEFARFPQGAKGLIRGNRFTAPLVLYSAKQRLVQCPQGVEGTFDGHPLQAASLYWDVDRELLDLPGTVSGARRGLTFTAQRAQLNLKTRQLKANGVSAQIRIEDEDDLESLR